ncbi:MAG: hypothetical protein IMZ50_06540 [Candidatus Atribacteria bacterium]|nr:hypothetical protein [Candidatus Atribacteria bacterium]
MAPPGNGNGHGWKSLQTIALIGMLLFLIVEKIIIPSVNSGKLADAVQTQDTKIAVLEEVITTLRPLPNDVAGLKIMVDSVKRVMDRIETKLDNHIDKR